MSAMSVVAFPTTRLCPSMLRKGKWEWRFRLADETNEVGVRWVSGGCSSNTHLRFSLCTRAFPKIEVGGLLIPCMDYLSVFVNYNGLIFVIYDVTICALIKF